MATTSRSLRGLAAISAVQGACFAAYAIYVAVQGVRLGATGPAPVSNVPGLILEVLIFALFGAALLLVARGFLLARRWARSPFVLGQLLGLVVAVPLAQSGESPTTAVGVAWAVTAVAGIVLSVLPATTESLAGEDT